MPFEQKWMREAELCRKDERAKRMYRKKYGEEVEVSLEEPCFDWNSKEYIKTVDVDAEKYEVKRLRATIARSSDVQEAIRKPERKKPR